MDSFNTNILRKLISPWNGDKGLIKELENFSNYLGWYPSDIIEDKNKNSITTGHLFVEHGLENSAVISFIQSKYLFTKLTEIEKLNLFSVSYNNLVDLHISIDRLNACGTHNRLGENNLIHFGSNEDEINLKSSTYSELLQERRIKPIYKTLDDTIIDTISFWKRIISSELDNTVNNEQLSSFFNSIIFLRAIEDYNYNLSPGAFNKNNLNRILESQKIEKYSNLILNFLEQYKIKDIPNDLIDFNILKVFDKLNSRTLYQLFQDFYQNKYSHYEYDFSIISKHALSRLYEKYVSILEIKETEQLSFFSPIPEEKFNKNSGSYYTPQFIARFFTKYLEFNIKDIYSKNLTILEPAVGSGIFIRTFLERQIETNHKEGLDNNIFKNIIAVDKNKTACNAANLSLSLLHLVSYGELPKDKIQIVNDDSLAFFKESKYEESVDIIISNPPYIKYNSLDAITRKSLKEFLGELSFGKTDLYIAFVKIAIQTLKEGGYGCFVLPNTFLTTDSCQSIRKELFDTCSIECIVDLSDNRQRIFEEAGVYPILLIFKKSIIKSNAIISKIQDNTGQAIHHILKKDYVENDNFSVYEVDHNFFNRNKWFLLPPTELSLKNKISKNPNIKDFFDVRTGFASGHVDAFTLSKNQIPKGEESIYVPYLEDRKMNSFSPRKEVEEYFFYPFINDSKISEEELLNNYPKTYRHLKKFESDLLKRNEVKKGNIKWWMPNRPRSPKFMLVPKILTPHLIFTPKFNIDIEGKFAISRSPFLVLKKEYDNTDLLYYFTGILNSTVCLWYLISHAPKYQNGFAMLEPTYIKGLPIPSPFQEDTNKRKLVQDVLNLVKKRIISNEFESLGLEKQIDSTVAELYNLTSTEKSFLNI
ncbi:MAG: N-6 DNA methylase [Bacteroidales bacterium]|jgi:methylase of polypeptide subunit release factors|nr:N-6 DNA methylase [Bacteroidales bacterium]